MIEKCFSKKIQYLYAKLNVKGKEFTKLFWDGDKKKFSSRHATVHKSWLDKGIDQVKGFYFDKYEISTYKIGDEVAFTETSFMYDSFKDFKERVDRYIEYKRQSKELCKYKYIYYYYRKKEKIVYAKLETLEQLNKNKYKVKITLPQSFKEKNIQPYVGTLEINNERYYISVSNNIEILTLYFVLGRGYTDNSKVYGIGLGISYQGGLVEATKEMMTIELLDRESEEEATFYLSANESEYLLADEILLREVYSSLKDIYVNKLNNKLNNLATFIKKSRDSIALQNSINTDPYLNIFYKSFIGLNEISKKVTQNQYYFVNRRRPIMKNFFRTIANRENSACNMVYPVFKSDSILFEKNDDESKKFLDICMELSESGLVINMIFIINNEFKITKYFKKTISNLLNSQIYVKISFIEDIDKLKVSSYDFIYAKEKDVAVYTSLRDRIRMFKVSKAKEKIRNLVNDYNKIENISFRLDELEVKKELVKDKTLERLVGTWHYYAYGSLIVDITEFRLWHSIVTIHKDGGAHYRYKNMTQHSGDIDTTYNPNQSYIRFTNHDSSHLALITIDNKNIYKDIFKITMLRKQFGITLDMVSFGVFSKKELNETLVKKALGNPDEVMLRENIELEKRINELYIESRS